MSSNICPRCINPVSEVRPPPVTVDGVSGVFTEAAERGPSRSKAAPEENNWAKFHVNLTQTQFKSSVSIGPRDKISSRNK